MTPTADNVITVTVAKGDVIAALEIDGVITGFTMNLVVATDINQAVLDIAAQKNYGNAEVVFRRADIYDRSFDLGAPYDAGFAGFWETLRSGI